MASATAETKPKPTVVRWPENLYGQDLLKYIFGHAENQQIATLSIATATHEGGFYGAVGDQGTSFGPWQLHQGGKLPAGLSGLDAARWANSPTGIDYGLAGLTASVAKVYPDTSNAPAAGAIRQIVNDFERPREDLRQGEIANIQRTYARWADTGTATIPSVTGGVAESASDAIGSAGGAVADAAKSTYQAFTGVGSFFKWLGKGENLIRILEVGGGAALVAIGVIMLGKASSGAAAPASQVASAVGSVR